MDKFKLSRLFLIACWLGLQSFTALKVNRLNVEGSIVLKVNRFNVEGSNQYSNLQPATPTQAATFTKPAILSTKALKCPADVETLSSLLLRDLPSYANRVMQRSRRLNRIGDSYSYVVVAGHPEFEPLSLGPGQYTSTPPTEVKPPEQVFFTTLERRYYSGKAIYSQLYHWLFLTQTSDGWRMALMFSRIGSSAKEHPPTPPYESSNGIVGQAVNTWLRDCRAGTLRPQRTTPRRGEAGKQG